MEATNHDTGATGVRIVGDRVHRRTGPWTPAVHALIAHARAAGLVEAPELLGFDDDGNEVVRYVAGDLGAPDHLSDARLAAVGRLVRRLDDALGAFEAAPAHRWRSVPTGTERLAHGDVAPWNLVFAAGTDDTDEVVALLDWDFAGLAPAGYDLAYAAWTCVPLEPDTGFEIHELAARLRRLVVAHGAPPPNLLELLAFAQTRVTFHVGRGGVEGDLGLPGIWRGGRHVGRRGRAMAWLDEHWDVLATALRS